MKYISRFLSTVFAPLLVPTYGMMIASFLSILSILSDRVLWTSIAMVFILTCVVPAVGIYTLHRLGYIKDPGLNDRSERAVPYIIATVGYIATALILWRISAPVWLVMFMVGATVAVVINIIVTRWWKISAHAAAMGGLVALVMRITALHQAVYDMNVWISASILVAGAVMTARVYLGRHTLLQVIAGAANGFLCVWLFSMIR